MNKLVLIAVLTALSACSQKPEQAAAPAEPAAAPAPAPAPAVDPSLVGTYDVKLADGSMGKTVINADGTYVDTDAQGKEIKGTFSRNGNQDCFDPEGDAPVECWTSSPPAADGTFTSTSPDGKSTVTVSRATPDGGA